jgi:hypothetical protein
MTANEKQVLHDIVNALENLAESVDSLESILIRGGQLTTGEIEAESLAHVHIVVNKLVGLRRAIDSTSPTAQVLLMRKGRRAVRAAPCAIGISNFPGCSLPWRQFHDAPDHRHHEEGRNCDSRVAE